MGPQLTLPNHGSRLVCDNHPVEINRSANLRPFRPIVLVFCLYGGESCADGGLVRVSVILPVVGAEV